MKFGLKNYRTYERRGIKNVSSKGSRGEGVNPYFLAWHGCAPELMADLVISQESHKTGPIILCLGRKRGSWDPRSPEDLNIVNG